MIVFPEFYRTRIPVLQKDTPLLVKGTVDKTEKGIKIVSTEISRLDAVEIRMGHRVEISIKLPLPDHDHLKRLRSILAANGMGKYPLYLRIFSEDTETVIATDMKMSDDSEMISKVEKIAGKGAVVFQ